MQEGEMTRPASENSSQLPNSLNRREFLIGRWAQPLKTFEESGEDTDTLQQQKTEPLPRPYLRKKALQMIAGVPIALYLGERLGVPLYEQFDDSDRAGISNEVFYQMHEEKFKNLRLGTTFVPSEFGSNARALDALRYTVEELGIRDIRLPLRWDKTSPESGKVDLTYYDPFIRYMRDHGVRICPSFGYKAARWPEHYPPDYVQNSETMLSNGEEITPEKQLGKEALQHIQLLSDEFVKLYPELTEEIYEVQAENEPFQRFGTKAQTFNFSYMHQAVEILRARFPNAKFLVNGGGPDRLPAIVDFFEHLILEDPTFRNRLKLGYDYYFARPEPIPLADKVDPITKDRWLGNNIALVKKRASEVGYEIEITEGQAEEWGDKTYARDSIDAFRFMLLRGMRVLDMRNVSVLRIWGVEKMYKKKIDAGPNDYGAWSDEDRRRELLIKRITSQRVEELNSIYERIKSLFGITQQ